MPATSEAQKTLFCIALSIKRGETLKTYSAQAAKIAEENDEETLREYCEAPVEKK
ncbi:unnamed protein product [marine sediment metagenome]|uniref:Uncharacterized protein n=1 Tax=marine sediment metagenome TaxID=412755 RepID=X1SMC2_9ZZZZ